MYGHPQACSLVMNRAGLTGDLVKRYEEGRLKLQVRSYSDIQPDETYDYVICHEVIEHIKEPLELLQAIHFSARICYYFNA